MVFLVIHQFLAYFRAGFVLIISHCLNKINSAHYLVYSQNESNLVFLTGKSELCYILMIGLDS